MIGKNRKKIFITIVLLSSVSMISAMEKTKGVIKKEDSKKVAFFVTRPLDEYWNTMYGGLWLVQAMVPGKVIWKGDEIMKVVAPKEFRHPSVSKSEVLPVADEVFLKLKFSKVARKLKGFEEELNLIRHLNPEQKPPKGMEFLNDSKDWGKSYKERKKLRAKKRITLQKETEDIHDNICRVDPFQGIFDDEEWKLIKLVYEKQTKKKFNYRK